MKVALFHVLIGSGSSVELHLETRFAQLDAASKLELWQEAFRTVEDIHGLFMLLKKVGFCVLRCVVTSYTHLTEVLQSPKPQMMASYYEKLVLVFWKCDNHLV